MNLFEGLLANIGILALFLSVWSLTFDWTRWLRDGLQLASMAVAGSACAIALMTVPIQIMPGIIQDLRAVPIALAGYLGGPLVGLAVGLAAAIYRLYVGGIGADAAMVQIGVVTGVGIAMGLIQSLSTSPRSVLILAVVMAVVSAAGVPFLPAEVPSSVRWTLALSSIGATFVGVLLLGASISNELRRLKTFAENTLYRALMEAFPEPLNAKDMDGRFIAANSATARLMLAGSASDLIGKTDFDFYPHEIAAAFRKDEEAVLAAHRPAIIEQHVARLDDSTAWISTLKVPLVDDNGEEAGLLTHNRDISELKRLRDDRERAYARLNDALASMADAIAVFDGENRLVLCNELYRSTFPKTAALRVPGAALGDLLRAAFEEGDIVGIDGDDRDAWIADMLADRRTHRQHLLWLGDGRVVSVRIRPGSEETSVVVISDVTEEHRGRERLAEMNRQLVDLARTDSLTGLANRRVLDDTLATELRRSTRTGSPVSLLMIDIDRFKAFNDAHGHLAGDACLRQVARAMSGLLKRPGDLVSRYGGEEFAVILADTDADGAAAAAERLRREIEQLRIHTPIGLAESVTISIGVATATGGVEVEPAALIGAADRALYQAKSEGRNGTVSGSLE